MSKPPGRTRSKKSIADSGASEILFTLLITGASTAREAKRTEFWLEGDEPRTSLPSYGGIHDMISNVTCGVDTNSRLDVRGFTYLPVKSQVKLILTTTVVYNYYARHLQFLEPSQYFLEEDIWFWRTRLYEVRAERRRWIEAVRIYGDALEHELQCSLASLDFDRPYSGLLNAVRWRYARHQAGNYTSSPSSDTDEYDGIFFV
jgi:hypothetical protein